MGYFTACDVFATERVGGNAYANSTTATAITPLDAVGHFRTGEAWQGRNLLVRASGRISTVVTTPGTITFGLRFGGTTVATSGALALNVVAKVNVTWRLLWHLTVRGVGSTSSFIHTGFFCSEAVIGSPLPSAGGSGGLVFPASAPAAGTTFSNNGDNLVDLMATWSVASASNSISCHQFSIVSLG